MLLLQDQLEDFVIATGKQYTVRQFVEWSAAELGVTLRFDGAGVDEKAVVVSIDGDKAPAPCTPGRRCGGGCRPTLLPPDRGRNPAGRPDQSQNQTGLGARNYGARDVRRNGGRRSARRPAPCAVEGAWARCACDQGEWETLASEAART